MANSTCMGPNPNAIGTMAALSPKLLNATATIAPKQRPLRERVMFGGSVDWAILSGP
ncbi:MAG: hypothetical protein GDA36_10825 [Rhodobacteraceae bacterium]|nr:hypothetical protein [Paracoccaceae bacterium]